METTIDRAGRVVIPKALRDALSLNEGAELDIRLEDGRIIVEARPVEKHIAAGPHGAVVHADVAIRPMSPADVREILEQLRR